MEGRNGASRRRLALLVLICAACSAADPIASRVATPVATRVATRGMPSAGLREASFRQDPAAEPRPVDEEAVLLPGEDEPVLLSIALDELAVVASPAAAGAVAELLAAEGASSVASASPVPGWSLARFTEPRTAGELTAIATRLRAQDAGVVRDAGLVARRAGSDTPMILAQRLRVVLSPGLDPGDGRTMIESGGGQVLRASPIDPRDLLVAATDGDGRALALALAELDGIDRVMLDPISPVEDRGPDPLLPLQWFFDNDGASTPSAVEDADVDAPEAWALGRGSGTLIAVVDHGFQADHEDLAPNVHALSSTSTVHAHGTAVAGLAGARGGNDFGGCGACPECSLLLIDRGSSDSDNELAIREATASGAAVINLSWGYSGAVPPNVKSAVYDATEDGRGGLGAVVVVAAPNGSTDMCKMGDIAAFDFVLGVSSTDNRDRRMDYAFGDCLDLMATVGWWDEVTGDWGGNLTTDVELPSDSGYNDGTPSSPCGDVTNAKYARCFNKNSAAAPIVAGAAALVIAAVPTAAEHEVRRALQDTADRVDDPQAAWRVYDGRSHAPNPYPTTPPELSLYGMGRLNAFEAVRLVAPTPLGRGRVDVFVRDNHLDWGNTEQPSNHRFGPAGGFEPHWKSVDVKVDGWPLGALVTDAAGFEALLDEDPVAGRDNRVYVRVRNRGRIAAAGVVVKVHWAFAGAGLPALPSDFWGAFPADSSDTSIWHPLARSIVDVPYSGPSILTSPATDPAAVAAFAFAAPPIDFALPNPQHFCFFVVLSCADDPVVPPPLFPLVPDEVTPVLNNVTQRNVKVVLPPLPLPAPTFLPPAPTFFLNNPYEFEIRTRLRVLGPPTSGVTVVPPLTGLGVVLAPGARQPVFVRVNWMWLGRGELDLLQERLDGTVLQPPWPTGQPFRWLPIGGFTLNRP